MANAKKNNGVFIYENAWEKFNKFPKWVKDITKLVAQGYTKVGAYKQVCGDKKSKYPDQAVKNAFNRYGLEDYVELLVSKNSYCSATGLEQGKNELEEKDFKNPEALEKAKSNYAKMSDKEKEKIEFYTKIANGITTTTTKVLNKDKNGIVLSSKETISEPSATERMKAREQIDHALGIDTISKNIGFIKTGDIKVLIQNVSATPEEAMGTKEKEAITVKSEEVIN